MPESKAAVTQAASTNGDEGSVIGDISAVCTLTVCSVGFAVSLAVLVFSGPLESGMSRAVGCFVVGSGVMSMLVARRSQIVPVATFVQDGPAIVMASVAGDFVVRTGAEVSDVFVLLVVTMLATSFTTALLAHFRLGELGLALPAPVVGAFVGGTGWLLFRGGLDVMISAPVRITSLQDMVRAEAAMFWAPGMAIGLLAWRCSRSKYSCSQALALLIGTGLAGFYAVVALASSFPAVESGGWLLGPFPEAGGLGLVSPQEFVSADWSRIAMTTPGILSVVGVACAAQLFSLTGIRSQVDERVDLDAELRVSATANLAAAFCGATPGFQGLGYTVLLRRMGATRRAVPLISGGFVVAFGIAGVAVVGYVPRFIVGALLVLAGLTLFDAWRDGLIQSTDRAEKVLSLLIVGIVAWFGLLPGIGFGMVAAALSSIVHHRRGRLVRPPNTGQLVDLVVRERPREVAPIGHPSTIVKSDPEVGQLGQV